MAGAASMEYLNRRQASDYHTPETEKYLGFDPARREQFVGFWRSWWNRNPELHARP